jgi:putative cardiolipin synthase
MAPIAVGALIANPAAILAPAAAPVLAAPLAAAVVALPAASESPSAAAPNRTAAAKQSAQETTAPAGNGSDANSAASASLLFDGAASRPAGPNETTVGLILDNAESRAARSDMVTRATKSVFATYYKFRMDEAGLRKLKLLRDAARRGLDVRLVLDAAGSRVTSAMIRHLVDSGVQVRVYHPLTLGHPSWIWRRSHDKWLIVDGAEAILGDRNMADEYFGIGQAPWVSREAHVVGLAAAQAHAHAADVWNGTEVRTPRRIDKVPAAAARAAGRLLDALGPEALPLPDVERPWAARARPLQSARFVHDPVVTSRKVAGTARAVLRLISGAKSTIVIEDAYVVLPKIFQRALAAAVARGVRVVIVTNSPETHNTAATRYAYTADLTMLARLGVELWEFQGPGTVHAKAMVVDGRRLFLGSFNLDPRSLLLNSESGLIADDPDLARELLLGIAGTRARSRLVALRGAKLIRRRPTAKELLLRPLAAALRPLI